MFLLSLVMVINCTGDDDELMNINIPPLRAAIFDSSDICSTFTLVTYYLNLIARQDICTKCLKCRKTRYWPPGMILLIGRMGRK